MSHFIWSDVHARIRQVFSFTRTHTTLVAFVVAFSVVASAHPTAVLAAATINTTTTITNASTLSSTPSNAGSSYGVNVSVTRASGSSSISGTVTVSDGSVTCTDTNPSGSGSTVTYSCNLTSTTAGVKTITASYAGNSTYIASVSAGVSHTVNVPPAPDLVVTKTNSLSGNATLGTPFNWVLTITNSGTATATFGGFLSTETIVSDSLPSTGATYGSVTDVNAGGTSGTVNCSISSNNLTCQTNGLSAVTIPVGGSIVVTVPVTPTASGSLVNPRAGGSCAVDSGSKVSESNEANNSCANTVTVDAPLPGTLTVNASVVNDDAGSATIANFTLKVDGTTVVNGASTSVTAGSHTVTVTGPSGYSKTFGGNCNASGVVSVISGGASTCSLVLDDYVTPYVPVAGNLILNPSVETGSGDTATSWTNNSYGSNTAVFSRAIGGAHSATTSAKIVMTNYVDGDAKWLPSPVSVTAGQYYTFTEWYKSDIATEIDVIYTINGNEVFEQLGSTPAQTNWTQFTGNFLVPVGATSVRVAHILAGNGTLSTDDYSLVLGTAPVFSEGMVTLTFDDGWRSFFENGVPVLNAAGLKATAYLNTDPIVGEYPDYIWASEVALLQSQGHDIGGHTKSHVDLTQSATDLTTEINGNRTYLQTIATPSPVDTLAYPYGTYNDTVIAHIQSAGYLGARTVDQGYNFTNTDKFKLKIQHVTNLTTVAEAKSWIDTAKAQKVWLILMFHKVMPGSDTAQCSGDEECTTADFLKQVGDYLVAQNVATPTMHQGLAVMNGASVPDTIKPVLSVPGTVNVNATSLAGATVTFSATATDNVDAHPVVACSPLSGTVFAIGTTTVTCTATDASGNATSSPFAIVVTDTAPTISAHAGVTVSATSLAGATVTYTLPAVTDNIDALTATCLPVSGSVFPIGNTTVTCTATDSGAHFAIPTTFVVTVQDTAPVITLNGANPITLEVFTPYVDLGASALDAVDGIVTVTPSGSVAIDTVGSYVITYTATDSALNATSTTRTVDVVDTTKPVIALSGDSVVTLEVHTPYTDLGATATDNYDGAVSVSMTDVVNVDVVGTYVLHYNATDAHANVATEVIRTVNIVDTTQPTITLIGANPQVLEAGSAYVELGGAVSDNYDTGLSAVVDSSAINTAVTGDYMVQYSVSDASGNATSTTRTVTVQDTIDPVVSIDPVTTPTNGHPSIVFSVTDATAVTTECSTDDTTFIPCISPFVPTLTDGTYTVTVRATDSVGHSVSAPSNSFEVDGTAPVITVTTQPASIINTDSTSIEFSVSGATSVVCTLDTIVMSCDTQPVSLSGLSQGAHAFVVTATDVLVNTTVVSIDFTVDNIAPAVTLLFSSPTKNTTPDIGFTVVDATAVTTECSTDDTTFIPCISPFVPTLTDGTYTVTVRATDGAGNVGDTSGSLIINTQAPVLTVDALSANSGAVTGTTAVDATVAVTIDGHTYTSVVDGAGLWTATITDALSDAVYPVSVTATDPLGNTATDNTRTLLIDTVSPVVTQADLTIEATGPSGAVATFAPTVVDTTAGLVAVCSPASGTTFALGTTTVTCTADDALNPVTTMTFDVGVIDSTEPVITLLGTHTMSVAQGSLYVDPGFTVSDLVNASGVIATSTAVTWDGNSVAGVDTGATSTIPFIITYTATDLSGNATSTTREVTVSDLSVSTEQVVTPGTNSITITWTTSHPSTSRVVYGLTSVSNASSTEAGAPNYGYTNTTVEDATLVTNHSVVVSGLSSGTTYYLRPVSHGSPETAGNEVSGTTTTPAPASSGNTGGGGGGGGGIVTTAKTYSILDFNSLIVNWGKTGVGISGDFNVDGKVDILDFNLLLINWKK